MAQAATKTQVATLEIEDLHVEIEGKEILKGIDLTVRQGEVHALMGPNGSGKSTLAQVLMGRTSYRIKQGSIRFRGEDITRWTADKRAQHGLFLAFQYPTEIPGVSVVNFLRSAYKAAKGEQISALAFRKRLKEKMNLLGVEDQMVNRYVNQGFSGGEKKKNEVLQLAVLEPDIAILDETDSGLDIDSLKEVAQGIDQLIGPDLGVLLITHYQRILNYITPDRIHVMMDGRIVLSGGPELGHELEQKGYEGLRKELGVEAPIDERGPASGAANGGGSPESQ
jgi:Fe-S cluster assembly ATP-binding protein